MALCAERSLKQLHLDISGYDSIILYPESYLFTFTLNSCNYQSIWLCCLKSVLKKIECYSLKKNPVGFKIHIRGIFSNNYSLINNFFMRLDFPDCRFK